MPKDHFERIEAFSDKIVDIHEFLHRTTGPLLGIRAHENNPPFSPPARGKSDGRSPDNTRKDHHYKIRHRVTFHDPCHLRKGLGIWREPRDILRSLPTVDFVEMNEPDACCGFGGIFSLYHYDLASKIGEKKARNIEQSRSEIVATGCPGCKIHIEDSLHRAGYNAKVMHTVELLEEIL